MIYFRVLNEDWFTLGRVSAVLRYSSSSLLNGASVKKVALIELGLFRKAQISALWNRTVDSVIKKRIISSTGTFASFFADI